MTDPTYTPGVRAALKAEGIPPADEHPELYGPADAPLSPEAAVALEAGLSAREPPVYLGSFAQYVDDEPETDEAAPPSVAEETNMELTWEDKFADSGTDPKHIARATNILQALRANGVSQRRIDERGKGLLATLMQGKAPKESRTREERQRENLAMPEQQTLPDSVAVMRAERDQLSREIDEFDELRSAMDAKRERYALLCRMLAAGEEA